MAALSKPMLLFSLGSAYCLAGCLMEHLTLFEAWRHISSEKDLRKVQQLTGMRTLYIYVLPKTAMTAVLPFLVRDNPRLWFSIGMMAISWISSFMVQIPLQLRVQNGADRAALETLLKTTWIRTATMVAHCAVVLHIVLDSWAADCLEHWFWYYGIMFLVLIEYSLEFL